MRQKGAGDSGKKTSAVKEDDGFIARRSTHVTGPSNADGDTWQETLAVCELAGKLVIRSYFSNTRTQERQWDEPPSGASRVVHASEKMHKMAKMQLQEMEIAVGNIPDTDVSTPKLKRAGLGGFFRRAKVDSTSPTAKGASLQGRIQYKPDSLIGRAKHDYEKSHSNEALDPALQRALVSSLSCKGCAPQNQDAELERVIALSLLEALPGGDNQTSSRRQDLVYSGQEPDKDHLMTGDRRRLSPQVPRESAARIISKSHQQHIALSEAALPTRRDTNAGSRHQSRQQLRGGPPPSSAHAEVSKHRPDPPSTFELLDYGHDKSCVRYAISHDDDESLAIALSLSLMEGSMCGTCTGVASILTASDFTEEHQVHIAMEESVASAPPEMKKGMETMNDTPMKRDSLDWEDRKMPARSPTLDHLIRSLSPKSRPQRLRQEQQSPKSPTDNRSPSNSFDEW